MNNIEQLKLRIDTKLNEVFVEMVLQAQFLLIMKRCKR